MKKKTVFIAMPFSDEFNSIYDKVIEQVFLKWKMNIIRVDKINIHSDIVQDIEKGIAESDIVFADLTGNNSNVFYEVGFSKALNKSLITAVQESYDIKFDLRQKRHIIYNVSNAGLKKFEANINRWVNEIMKPQNRKNLNNKSFIHGTKFTVPKQNAFWSSLFKKANKKFYLVGGTNKSWIKKSEEQSKEMADSIIRIIKNGGVVKLISKNQKQVIDSHKLFYEKYLKHQILEKEIFHKFKANFSYGTINHSNYQAVITDSKVVILPIMNSEEFKDESIVLEFEDIQSSIFKNYCADIDRLMNTNNFTIINLEANADRKKNSQRSIKPIKK